MYKRYRLPPEIIHSAVWLYCRFNLSHRDIEDLLARRGIVVSRESIRLLGNKFGSKYATRLRTRHQGYGEVVAVCLQKRRNPKAAKRFLCRLLKNHKCEPKKIVTDKLLSYCVAHRDVIPEAIHRAEKYANNRTELSQQPTDI